MVVAVLRLSKKRSFTLIEIIICIFILGMFSSFVGVKGYQLVQNYQFNQATAAIKEEIATARHLAKCYNCSFYFYLLPDEDGVQVQRICYELHSKPYLFNYQTKIGHINIDHKELIFIQPDGWIEEKRIELYSHNQQASLAIKHCKIQWES